MIMVGNGILAKHRRQERRGHAWAQKARSAAQSASPRVRLRYEDVPPVAGVDIDAERPLANASAFAWPRHTGRVTDGERRRLGLGGPAEGPCLQAPNAGAA